MCGTTKISMGEHVVGDSIGRGGSFVCINDVVCVEQGLLKSDGVRRLIASIGRLRIRTSSSLMRIKSMFQTWWCYCL